MPILALKAIKNWKGKRRVLEEEEEVEKVAPPEPLVKPLTEPKYKVVLIRDKEQSNGGQNEIFPNKIFHLIRTGPDWL